MDGRTLADYRQRKDAFFRSHPSSPLTPEQQEHFTGLQYYPENPNLVFIVEPELFPEPELVTLATTDGSERPYLRWARATFQADGRAFSLTVFRDPETGALFVPFRDATSGTETYDAGRYLEPRLLPDGRILLDFNYAENPYCSYNDNWSCALPPPENQLPIPIRAGERRFEGHG
jgi:uncharacterized protein (DUF1684 family)